MLSNQDFLIPFGLTILLGMYFTGLQAIEYGMARFRLADSVYGSIFYVRTGFHGGHVIVGSLFLLVIIFRCGLGRVSRYHHLGYELAIWY